MGLNLFKKPPRTQNQRDRWLTLIDVVQNGRYSNHFELIRAVQDRGHFISRNTIRTDLDACNIYKLNGVYTVTPYSSQDVVQDIVELRMRASVLSVFHQDDIIVLNTQRGAGPWVGSALREFDDDRISSLNEGHDTVWVLAAKDQGKHVYDTLHEMFQRSRVRRST